MARPFKELHDKMTLESQARARELTSKMLTELENNCYCGGSSFDEFLEEEGILEAAEIAAKAKVKEWKNSHSFNYPIFDLYYNGRGCEFWEAWILATQ
jgi:hypothetical protein